MNIENARPEAAEETNEALIERNTAGPLKTNISASDLLIEIKKHPLDSNCLATVRVYFNQEQDPKKAVELLKSLQGNVRQTASLLFVKIWGLRDPQTALR